MKGSNIKFKMYRLTFSAGILLAMGGLWVSCEDELLTGQPDWLGSSIYEELEKRGNFTTALALINDGDVSPVDVNGETANARTLRLTGSKTFFVAPDEAYEAFFKNNSWGAKNYGELTVSQKKLLFNSSLVNSAYLIELMSSIPSGDAEPREGVRMRRTTNFSVYDSVPKLTASDMPDNSYWKKFRMQYPDGGDKKMVVMRDDKNVLMNHLLPSFMQARSITGDDLNFLTNGLCRDNSEAYVNGRRVAEKDITCQNGYIQVLDGVPVPLRPVAEVIRNDQELSVFSSLLDRFCVPVYAGRDETEQYNLNTGDNVDSLFVWRYLNRGFLKRDNLNADVHGQNNSLFIVNGLQVEDMLLFDPGWNAYADGQRRVTSDEDMSVIIAPTNKAFEAFFAGSGAALYDRYNHNVDSIPDNIIVEMLDEFMRASLVATVPSKFGSVSNSAQYNLGLEVGQPGGQTGVFSCEIGSNGMVYKSNEVYKVPAYSSVYYPTLIFDNLKIMNWAIVNLAYDAYLKSMDSEYMFIIPTMEALQNYVDPVDYHKSQKTLTEFYYDDRQKKVRCRRYRATSDGMGGLVKGTPITTWSQGSTEDDYIKNRMSDILDNCIIVKDGVDPGTGKELWVTKGGMPVVLDNPGNNVQIYTPYRKEIAQNGNWEPMGVRAVEGYYDMGHNPSGNGMAFIVDKEVPMSASKSVMTVLSDLIGDNSETSDYAEFYQILEHMGNEGRLVNEFYDYTTGQSTSGNKQPKTVSNGKTINVMDNFNYTVYVPRSEEIKKLYELSVLPDWREVEQLSEEIENEEDPYRGEELTKIRDMKNDSIESFVRYHIQNNAIYLNAHSVRNGEYESSLLKNGRFATLSLSGTGNTDNFSIICQDSPGHAVSTTPRKVVEGNHFAREYRFRTGVSDNDGKADSEQPRCARIDYATRIYNSSTAVVHLIDKPLLYSSEMNESYEKGVMFNPNDK